MSESPFPSPLLFCPTCHRYLGSAEACPFCGWQRAGSMRIPRPDQPLWRLSTAHAPHGAPLALGETLVCADKAGALYAARATDGVLLWRHDCGGPLRAGIVLRGERLYMATRAGEVVALTPAPSPNTGRGVSSLTPSPSPNTGRGVSSLTPNPSPGGGGGAALTPNPSPSGGGGSDSPLPVLGEGAGVRESWRFPTRGGASGLTADERYLYFGDAEGNLYALHDAGDHAEIAWQVSAGQRISAAPLRWRHLLLVATHHPQGQLLALEVERGRLAWRRPLNGRGAFLMVSLPPSLSTPSPTPPHRRFSDGEGSGVGLRGAGGEVITATDQGRLSAYSLPEGDPLGWTFQAGGGLFAAPVAAGETVYVSGGDGRLTALAIVSGALRWSAALPERITGLACWRDLLYVATRAGMLSIFQAETGALVCNGKAAGRPVAGPFLHEGRLLVGVDSQGWIALPWHLGEYAWAARCSRAWGELESAASYFVLSDDPQAAEACWVEAGQAEKAARMWAAFGEDARAARLYCTAMEAQRIRQPLLAAAYLHRAAEHFEIAAEPEQAQRCRQQAARMGRFPYLRLEAFNLPGSCEAGQPAAIAVQLSNHGNGAAHNVQFRLGGQLARLVSGRLERPLPPGFRDVLEFENLIPTAVGRHSLRFFLTYADDSGTPLQAENHFDLEIVLPPPGVITVTDDAGVIRVRAPAGAPLPSVRVRGMAAMIKYEITENA